LCVAEQHKTEPVTTMQLSSATRRARPAGGGSCRPGAALLTRRGVRVAPVAPRAAAGDSPSSSSSSSPRRREMPIFPLGIVALPHATVPLMIFEPRYRVLFSTLLGADAEGVEPGLVQTESPYCASREFGMCYAGGGDGKMAAVGTALRIEQHLHEADGRMYITSRGTERFRVTRVVKERPVLICEVETIPEDADGAWEERERGGALVAGAGAGARAGGGGARVPEGVSQRARDLAAEVAETLRSTLRLHLKMSSQSSRAARRARPAGGGGGGGGGGSGAEAAAAEAAAAAAGGALGRGGPSPGATRDAAAGDDTPAPGPAPPPLEEDPLEPEELTELAPGPLSYWVAHVLGDARALQQSLLETEGTVARLEREKEVLESTLRFYSAATALESVFAEAPSSPGGGGAGGAGGGGGAGPPPGGPD